jgi:hypothetical protein
VGVVVRRVQIAGGRPPTWSRRDRRTRGEHGGSTPQRGRTRGAPANGHTRTPDDQDR